MLVIGQLPPPVHGSNVMTKRFVESLTADKFPWGIVEKKFSAQLTEVGKKDPKKLLKIPKLLRDVMGAVRENKPDFCVYFISVGISSLLVDCFILDQLRRKKIPYILYFHGRGYKIFESKILFRRIVRSILSNALGGLVLGKALKSDVSHCIREDRLYVLPNAIPERNPVQKKQKGITDKNLHILFLSNLIPGKGPMTVLKVAEQLLKTESGVRFTLAGRAASDDYLTQLKTFISKSGLEDSVTMTGPVYGENKMQLLDSADIFIFPTNFKKETFGIVNLEAIQCGIPVISTPIGAIPEIIEDGVNGFIVDPIDIDLMTKQVRTLIKDKNMRQRMGRNGMRIFKERYSLEAYRKNLKSAMLFFNNLLS